MLPTAYQQYIALSRYSRFREDLGRRETWPETVTRLLNFWEERFPEAVAPVREELFIAITGLQVMPSMRSLMTAGPALTRDEIAGYNPVTKDTLVLTQEEGLVPIGTLAGKTANVVNVEGRWAEATFNSFGTQPIYEVDFKLNSNGRHKVRCTANHRWVLVDGTVKPTVDLDVSDRIALVTAPKPEPTTDDYRIGLVHGLVFGDGTSVYASKRHKGYHLRLCGRKTVLAEYLAAYPCAYPPSFNGDPIFMLYDDVAKTHDFKSLPDPSETDDYLLGFIRGWFAADGSISASSQISLGTHQEGAEWLQRYAPRLGFCPTRVSINDRPTNFGQRTRTLHTVFFSRSGFCEEDFLDPAQRERFKPLTSHYVVTGVHPTADEEEVFCATVDDTNTFVLDKGLVTGNCSFTPVRGAGAPIQVLNRTLRDAGFDDGITVHPRHPTVFDNIMYILLCGTGVGFSVERQDVNELPKLRTPLSRKLYHPSNFPGVEAKELSTYDNAHNTIRVADSKYGWASALRILIVELYNGNYDIQWDLSKVRPAGAALKTFGGRSSGPGPLAELFKFTVDLFRNAQGERLTSIECHDLVCKIASVIVVGGVRRSALISLSNLSDERMRRAKTGAWWETTGHRALANNSAVYTDKPDIGIFMEEWHALYESKSGERGIFNRQAAQAQAARIGRDSNHAFGANPCCEIILRPNQLCNLSEIVVRPDDDLKSLEHKAELATILGTLQASLTNFVYLPPEWREACEEERLLGVSLTGIMDHPVLTAVDRSTQGKAKQWLQHLREHVRLVNAEWADTLGINPSTARTCIKPSGTVSQLVDSASGIHPRYAPRYVRRVRSDIKDPLTQFMLDQGFQGEPDVTNPQNVVFSFPMQAPSHAVLRNDRTAVQQLEHWLLFKQHWCDHTASVSIYVREYEWLEVGAWVYEHFDDITGISFFPYSDHVYQQAPYEELSEDQFKELVAKTPKTLDVTRLAEYETAGTTTMQHEPACVGGACDIA